MIVLGESCVAFVLRWSSPESNINSWPPSTFPLFSQDTCGDDDDNCDDDEKTEPMTWARLTWYNAMYGMHSYSEKWPQHKTLPKAQRTQGIDSISWVNILARIVQDWFQWHYLNWLQIWSLDDANCIRSKFCQQMAPLALVQNLVTRWSHFH